MWCLSSLQVQLIQICAHRRAKTRKERWFMATMLMFFGLRKCSPTVLTWIAWEYFFCVPVASRKRVVSCTLQGAVHASSQGRS